MKTITKIFVFILSLALIIGAVAMVTSANAGTENAIEFKVNGEVDTSVTTVAAAMDAIRRGHAGGADYTIKLLGNLTLSESFSILDSNCYKVGTTTAAGDDGVKRKTTFDLNGFNVDATAVSAQLFKTQRSYRAITVTGSGEIKLRAGGLFETLSGGAINMAGTGFGIKVTSVGGSSPKNFFNTSGSSLCEINLKNVNISLDGTVSSNQSEYAFNLNNTKCTFTNCTVNFDYLNSYTVATPKTYTFYLGGTSLLTLDNTRIVTTFHGIRNESTGISATVNDNSGKYSVIMDNSSLICTYSEKTFKRWEEIHGTESSAWALLLSNAMTITSNAQGDVYLKNDSIMSGNFRVFGGLSVDNLADPVIMTVDNSTLELNKTVYTNMGMSATGSGQGLFDNITYTNFINGATAKISGIRFRAGNSSASTAATKFPGVASGEGETGTYSIDFEIGTRIDTNNSSDVDLPSGASLVHNSIDGYYYVADAELKAQIENVVAKKDKIGTSLTRFFGIFKSQSETLGGLTGVTEWVMPNKNMTPGTDYVVDYVSSNTDYTHTVTWSENGETFRLADTSYLSLNSEDYYTSNKASQQKYKVAIMAFDFMPASSSDKSPVIKLGLMTDKKDGTTTSYASQIRVTADGSIAGGNGGVKAKLGEWNRYWAVINLDTCETKIYINGVLAHTVTTVFSKFDGMRLELNGEKYDMAADSSIAFANAYTCGYKNFIGGEFNVNDYLDGYMIDNTPYEIVNESYADINAALAEGAKDGAAVTVSKPQKGNLIIKVPGYIHSTAGALDLTAEDSSIIIEDLGNGYYSIRKLTKVSFVVGENTYVSATDGSYGLTLPDGLTVSDFMKDTVKYIFIGWSEEKVDHSTMTDDEYAAKVATLTVISNNTLIGSTPVEDVTYYPVYSVNKAAFSINAGGVKYFYNKDDLVTEMENAASTNTVRITLYDDITVSRKYIPSNGTGSDAYVRNHIKFDLNGHTLTIDTDVINGQFAGTARGHVTIENGTLKQKGSGSYVFQAHYGSASVNFNNVTIEASNLVHSTSNAGHNPYITLNNCTVTSQKTSAYLFSIGSHGSDSTNPEFIATNTTFYSDSIITDLNGSNGSVVIFDNCTIVTSDGKSEFISMDSDSSTDSTTYTNSTVFGTVNYNSILTGECAVFNYKGNITVKDEGKKLAYDNAYITFNEKQYRINVRSTSSNIISAIIKDEEGNVILNIDYIEGNDIASFADLITVPSVTVNKAIRRVYEGKLTKVSEGVYVTELTTTYTEKFAKEGVFVNLSLREGFDIYLYIAKEYYQFLDDASKAKFSKTPIEIEKAEYYYVKYPISRNANEAYTAANFSLTLTDGTYSAPVNYDVTLAEYLTAAIVNSSGDDRILIYSIVEYLYNAYNYFEEVDDKEATTLAEIMAVYKNLNLDLARKAPETNYDAIKNKGSIAISLTSHPSFVINSTEGGVVSLAGKTYTLLPNETLYISAKAKDFTNVLTITFNNGGVATYAIDDYVKNIRSVETDEVYTKELKALVDSFYSYILFASKDSTVAPAEESIDLSKVEFIGATYGYSGDKKSIRVYGDVPETVTVQYIGNGKTEAGTYTVTAKFYAAGIYLEGKDLTAIMTIKEKDNSFTSYATVVGKDGTKGTVSYVIDDGIEVSGKNAVKFQETYDNLKFSFAIPTDKFAELLTEVDEETGKLVYVMDNEGRYVYNRHEAAIETWANMILGANGLSNEIIAHTHTSAYWGWHDEGGEMSYLDKADVNTAKVKTEVFPVGSVSKEFYAPTQIIQEIFGEYENQYGIAMVTPGISANRQEVMKDGVLYPTCYTAYNDMLLETILNGSYIGSRNTGGAYVTTKDDLATKEGRYEIRSYMIFSSDRGNGANSTVEQWKDYIDRATAVGGWATFCLHNVCNNGSGSYYNLDEEYAHQLFAYTDTPDIWVAGYTEALLYYSEWSTSKVEADYIDGKIYVNLTDEEDDATFKYALTVKVTVPDTWEAVIYGDETLVVLTAEDGSHYVLANIVPDSGTQILKRAD